MRILLNFSKFYFNRILFSVACFFLPLSCFAQLTFSDEITINGFVDSPRCVFGIDLDGDGDIDILSASMDDDKIAWYENLDGLGNFGTQQIITTDAKEAESVYSADLDGDGDNDVLSASLRDDKIAWYENLDGSGSFGHQQFIDTDLTYAYSVFGIDLDGDGDKDVLAGARGYVSITWYENLDGTGIFGQRQVISEDFRSTSCVYSVDLDGDGDNDVLASAFGGDVISWFENTDGLGNFGPEQEISDAPGATSVCSSDLDGDGDNDVLFTTEHQDKVAWCENIDGLGNFGELQTIESGGVYDNYQSVFIVDLDGDGDNDVLASARGDHKVSWYENIDGLGDFSTENIISSETHGAYHVFSADLNGDGNYDVLSTSIGDQKVAWYENIDGFGNFGPQNNLTSAALKASSVFSIDLDGDGDNDVLSSSISDDKIAWYENMDGSGSFSPELIITTEALEARDVYSLDLDGDGDNDVLAAIQGQDMIAWYENEDGFGSFGPQQEITTNTSNLMSVFSIDLDGDGDNDVLSASHWDDKIAWYENLDGSGSFGPQLIITTEADGAWDVFSIDIDGDGDNDILSASYNDDKIAWYENPGNFTHIITTDADGAMSVFSIDLDGDGDNDVISASRRDYKIAWYENLDGLGDFGPQQIISTNTNNASSVFSIDLDGDGDNDILSTANRRTSWHENEDGLGNFGPRQFVSYNTYEGYCVYSIDLDGDLDNDVLVAAQGDDKIVWFRNGPIGISPQPFNLLQPDSGSVVDHLTVELTWEETTDPDDNFSHYSIHISDSLLILGDMLINNTAATSYTFTGEDGVRYWWSIVAKDHHDNETRANQVYSFTINLAGSPPLPFNLLQPENGAVIDTSEVLLEWEATTDPDNDFSSYWIHISDNPDNLEESVIDSTPATNYTFTEENNAQYWWTILARDEFDNETWANQVYSFTIDLTSVEDLNQQEFPTEYELTSIYPNPFNPSTTVTIGLPESSFLRLNVYNILGQHLVNLADNQFTAGYHNFTLDGSQLTSGIYFVSAIVEGKLSEIRKVVLMK